MPIVQETRYKPSNMMINKLDHKKVVVDGSVCVKTCKKHKPWLSDDLSDKWKQLRNAKRYKSKGSKKSHLKAEMPKNQRAFDKEVQGSKIKILI